MWRLGGNYVCLLRTKCKIQRKIILKQQKLRIKYRKRKTRGRVTAEKEYLKKISNLSRSHLVLVFNLEFLYRQIHNDNNCY